MSDDKHSALQELHNLMARTVAMIDGMEAMEHRVAIIVEGGRQQLGHLIADLHLPEMRAELREISSGLRTIERKLK